MAKHIAEMYIRVNAEGAVPSFCRINVLCFACFSFRNERFSSIAQVLKFFSRSGKIFRIFQVFFWKLWFFSQCSWWRTSADGTKMAVVSRRGNASILRKACKYQQTSIVRPFLFNTRSTLSNVCDSAREKRANVNRKKHLLCFWFCGGKKGCGSSNKHSVWICLLGSDDIQWPFNWVLSL